MMSSRLATLYTPRTIAAACLYDTLRELNVWIGSFEEWCVDIGKVDERDVDGTLCVCVVQGLRVDAVEDLRSLTREGLGKDIS